VVTGIDLLAFVVPVLILMLGAYVVHQARRSRESELNYKLRKCQIALDDAEQSLDNTVYYYKAEIGRLKSRLGEAADDDGAPVAAPRHGANGLNGRSGQDMKFRQAKNAFARLYHPDQVTGDDREKRIRIDIFKEFWDELERIDRRNP
jgi:hypothetical protein